MTSAYRFRARRLRRTWATLAAAVASALIVLVPTAVPASAATVTYQGPKITKISNNALRLSYGGHTYTCYYGDACVFRGGSFAAYYKCQTVANSSSSDGWVVNNQYGSGGVVTLYGKPGSGLNYARYNHTQSYSLGVHWRYISKFRTCDS